jgi:uncharacterized protein (TIGR03083 family)
MTTDDLQATITAERRAFSGVLAALTEADWNAPSLCAGWRTREVVAHMTMPFRFSAPRFFGELARSRMNFARMADRVAHRDGEAPIGTVMDGWLTNEDYRWKPPGGGLKGALTHDIVHGLDITIPLGVDHPVGEPALRAVLAHATLPLSLKHFGLDLTGIRLEAEDMDWSYGDGEPVRGQARHLLMVLMDRRLPTGLVSGAGARFASG